MGQSNQREVASGNRDKATQTLTTYVQLHSVVERRGEIPNVPSTLNKPYKSRLAS
jgi:hypothetical protein